MASLCLYLVVNMLTFPFTTSSQPSPPAFLLHLLPLYPGCSDYTETLMGNLCPPPYPTSLISLETLLLALITCSPKGPQPSLLDLSTYLQPCDRPCRLAEPHPKLCAQELRNLGSALL